MKKILLLLITFLLISCSWWKEIETNNTININSNTGEVDNIKVVELDNNKKDVNTFILEIRENKNKLSNIDCDNIENWLKKICKLEKEIFQKTSIEGTWKILKDAAYSTWITLFIDSLMKNPDYLKDVYCLDLEWSDLQKYCLEEQNKYYNTFTFTWGLTSTWVLIN